MKKVIKSMLLAVVLVSGMSCRHRLKSADYALFVNNRENGLKKTVEVNGWEFDIQYRPCDYIVLMENKGIVNGEGADKRKAELRGTAWFNISIKRADNGTSPLRYGITSADQYNSRLNYFLNEAQKDISLLYGKEVLQPASYLFENNYNLSPQETIVVGFTLPEGESNPQKNMRLSFIDKVFKAEIINAEFSKETLNNIPQFIY